MKKHLTKEVKEFINNNYNQNGGLYCAKQLNIPYTCVNNYAARSGLKVREDLFYYKNNVDLEKWRKMEDPTVCYLLGLIFSDGWVDRKRVNIQILKSDFDEILPKIKGIYNKATIFNRKRRHWKETTCFTLSSVLLSKMINELGFKDDNFDCIKYIPKHNLHHFFRGYLDGDGHIGFNKRKTKTGKLYGAVLQFSAPYNFDWRRLEKIINPLYANLKKTTNRKVSVKKCISKKNHKCSRLNCTNKEVILKFLDWIYSDWDQIQLGLSRKHKTYLLGKQSSDSAPLRDLKSLVD